jgi:hypothetical protein
MKLPKLNLPEFEIRTVEIEDRPHVWDRIRKKYVKLTPEEWVRQHFVNLLIEKLKYPRSLMKIESSHQSDQLIKRTDIKVYDRGNDLFLLVECKSPEVNLDEKVIQQISVYNQKLHAQYIAITNGLYHYVWQASDEAYHQLSAFPRFPA